MPAHWNQPTISCTPNVAVSTNNNVVILRLTVADNNTTCTVTNTPVTSNVTITKAVPGTDPTDFPFTATGPLTSNFTLDDDGTNANPFSNTITFNNLLEGQTYTFAEQLPPGWALDGNVSCSNVSGESQSPNGVSFVLASGNPTCAFNNVHVLRHDHRAQGRHAQQRR